MHPPPAPDKAGSAASRGATTVAPAAMALLLLFAFAGCRTVTDSPRRWEGVSHHMGTEWRIVTWSSCAAQASNGLRAAFARIGELDQCLTDYDPDSELRRLTQGPPGRWVAVSADLFRVLTASRTIAGETGDRFDPTLGPLVQLWRRARRQRVLPAPEAIEAARGLIGWRKVEMDAGTRSVRLQQGGMRLDLGGIAKGFAADEALKVLRENGLPVSLVAGSGDIALGDPPPGQAGWRIEVGGRAEGAGVPHTILHLSGCGVSTSGDLEQGVVVDGRRYSHIVDPRTGIGLTNPLQVTVVAADATHSDAYATTVCVMGSIAGLRFVDSEASLAAVLMVPEGTNWTRVLSQRAGGFLRP